MFNKCIVNQNKYFLRSGLLPLKFSISFVPNHSSITKYDFYDSRVYSGHNQSLHFDELNIDVLGGVQRLAFFLNWPLKYFDFEKIVPCTVQLVLWSGHKKFTSFTWMKTKSTATMHVSKMDLDSHHFPTCTHHSSSSLIQLSSWIRFDLNYFNRGNLLKGIDN